MVGPIKSGTISATGTVNLGEAAGSRVSSWLVHLDGDGSWSGSCQPVGKAAAREAGALATVNLAYKNMATGAVATAALTGDSLILIDSAGTEVILSFTRSAGNMTYVAVPVVG